MAQRLVYCQALRSDAELGVLSSLLQRLLACEASAIKIQSELAITVITVKPSSAILRHNRGQAPEALLEEYGESIVVAERLIESSRIRSVQASLPIDSAARDQQPYFILGTGDCCSRAWALTNQHGGGSIPDEKGPARRDTETAGRLQLANCQGG